MTQLTADGQRVVNDLAQRYGFSTDAVTQMLIAVINGNGSMAQFSHPEFGGSGQWMRGGMSMIGDMFNNALKGRVDGLCADIANLMASQPGLVQTGSFQSQSQSSGLAGQVAPQGASPFFKPNPRDQWYPAELGAPSATGSQNQMRYAYFANARRLAVDSGSGNVWIYDTLDHQIGGFGQQQGGAGSITFTSQYGTVNLNALPVVMRNGQAVTAQSAAAPAAGAASGPGSAEVMGLLEQLGKLKAQGVLTEEEFAAKKAQLLGRL
jgi:hypothetical protein